MDQRVDQIPATGERRRMERALRESEARLHSVLTSVPTILWALDRDGVFTFSEGRDLGALGLKPGDVVGRSVYDVYRDVPQVLDDTRRALAGEEFTSVVEVGEAVFESRYSSLRDESGEVVGVVGAAVDVTARRRAQAELEHSLSLLRATLESTADGILVVDREGRIVSFNRKFAEMWYLPPDLLASGDDREALKAVAGQLRDPAAFVARVRDLYDDPCACGCDVLELRDGRVFERYSQPQQIGSEVVGRVWSFRDITERRLAEEERKRREEESDRFQAALLGLARASVEELEPALRRITRADAGAMGVERVSVWFFSDDGSELVCRTLYTRADDAYQAGPVLRADELPDYFAALRERRVIAAHRAPTDPATHEFADSYLAPLGITSMLDVPVWREGEMIGVVCHEHTGTQREWTLDEQEFATAVADLVSLAVVTAERRDARREAQRMADRMAAVAAAASGVITAQSLDTLHEVLREASRRVIPFDAFTFGLYDEASHTLSYAYGYDGDVFVPADTVSLAGTPSERVVRERRSLVTLRSDDPEAQGTTPMGTGRRSESIIRSPILSGERLLGVLAVHSYTPGIYSEQDVAVLEAIAALAATALESIRLLAERRRAEDALRRAHEELERRVEERTAELAETNVALEEEIAERARAELELVQKTSELEAVFRALPDLYFRLDGDGTILDYQAGQNNGLYVPPEEFLGKRMQDVLPPEVGRQLADGLRQVADTRELVLIEYSLPVGDGEREYEARLVPLLDGQVITVVRDIADRKEAERALQRSEAHFRLLIENASDVATILDSRGVSTYQSPSVERVFGYKPEEMVGTSAFSRIHPDDAETSRAALLAMFREPGTVHTAEFRYQHKNGSWRVVEALGRTLLPHSAEAGVIINGRDITERKEAEEALRRNEERFRALTENASDLITVLDPDGKVSYQSPSIVRLLGYTPEELVGRNVFDLVHPDDAAPTLALLGDLSRGPGTVRSVEIRFRHRDGSWRYLEAVGSTLSSTSVGEGIVVNSRDVTERKQGEAALQQAKEEADRARDAAEEANRAKSEFLSRMSHELRTPMNSILGFAQILATKELPADQRRAVDHILKAGRHLLNLINEVLDIARIEANRQQLSLEPVRVGTIVQETLSLIRPMAADRECRVYGEVALAADYHVRADRQRLTQVLLNLLSNAVKYNRPGGSVRITCHETAAPGDGGGRLRIRVHDTGRGIPADRVGQLFVPFARLGAEQLGVEGTGLGLALSKRLVEAMGGSLELESASEHGSTFVVELPLVESPLERLAREGRADVRAGAQARGPVATLLYVEDNLANLALIETILDGRPEITLLSALQGRLGAELAAEHRPDLILLDLHLPDIPGDEVLARLQADPRTRDIPVVVISADATAGRIERLVQTGARDYMTKPIDVEHFLSTVDRILRERRS